MLGSIPVGGPRRENEFGSAIISLLDLSLSRPTVWPGQSIDHY